MKVTALTAAFTGTQRHTQPQGSSAGQETRRSFEEFLLALEAAATPKEDMETALKRALKRMEVLVGEEMAKSVVNEDGTINLARYAQVINTATRPYGAADRSSYANMPQVVNLVA